MFLCCFQYVDPSPGPIVLKSSGKEIGQHEGVHNYTLGKRLAVPISNYQSHDGLFVSELDYKNQVVYVVSLSFLKTFLTYSVDIF